jgi:hypothetical protein
MGRSKSRHALTCIAATLAGLGCLYACGSVPYGASSNSAPRHPKASAGSHATATATAPAGDPAATAYAQRVLSGLVVPAGTRQLPQRPTPAGLSVPALALSATGSVDEYRLYRLPLPLEAAAAFLRSHLPAGLVAEATGQDGAVGRAPTTLVVSATPQRLPAGVYSMELVDTIVRASSGSSFVRTDVQVISDPAPSSAGESTASSYRSVKVTMTGGAGPTVTTTSRSVIGTIEALLTRLPALPAAIRSCPAITTTYQLTLEPGRTGQPAVVISTGGCEVDHVSVGSRQRPALWDRGDKVFLLARSLLRPEVKTGWPMFRLPHCRSSKTQKTRERAPCTGKANPGGPRIPG